MTEARPRQVILGFLLLAPPAVMFVLWLYEFSRHPAHDDRVAAFLGHFPAALRDPGGLAWAALGCSAAAGVLHAVAAPKSVGLWRVAAVVGAFAAACLFFLNVWQLL